MSDDQSSREIVVFEPVGGEHELHNIAAGLHSLAWQVHGMNKTLRRGISLTRWVLLSSVCALLGYGAWRFFLWMLFYK